MASTVYKLLFFLQILFIIVKPGKFNTALSLIQYE